MKVNVEKSFNWSPDGMTVETVEAGQHELEGRVLEIAEELGCLGEPPKRRGRPPKPKDTEAEEQPDPAAQDPETAA